MALAELIVEMESTQYDELLLEQMTSTSLLANIAASFDSMFERLLALPAFRPASIENAFDLDDREVKPQQLNAFDSMVDILLSIDENMAKFTSFFIKEHRREANRKKFDAMDAAENRSESRWQDMVGYGLDTPKQKKKEEDGLWTMIKDLLPAGLAGGLGGALVAFAGKLAKFLKLGKKLFIPLMVVMSVIEGIQGFIDGFNANSSDTMLQKIFRGLTEGLSELVDTLFMVPLDLIKDLVSWIAKKTGNEDVSEWLDSWSYSEMWNMLTDHIEEFVTTVVGGIEQWLKRIVGDAKQWIDDGFESIGLPPMFGETDFGPTAAPTPADTTPISIPLINPIKSPYAIDVVMDPIDSFKQFGQSLVNPSQFMNEAQMNQAVKAGKVDPQVAEQKRKEFATQRQRLAQQRITTIEKAVQAGKMTKEIATTRIAQIIREYSTAGDRSTLERIFGVAPSALVQDAITMEQSTSNLLIQTDKTQSRNIQSNTLVDQIYNSMMTPPTGGGAPMQNINVQGGDTINSSSVVNLMNTNPPGSTDQSAPLRTRGNE